MGDKPDGHKQEPTLELPSFRLPRGRRRSTDLTRQLRTMVAAVVTGLLVGLVGVGSTYLAMSGCEAVRGTSTCGEGAGFFLLVAVLSVMVLVGAVLLKALQVSDPASTSFLAVGVVAVVSLLVLLDVVFSGWMFVVIPVLGGASYALSSWLTTRFADQGLADYNR